jgi:hypothetical protein
MPIKRPDTPLAETPKPDYRNIPTSKKSFFKDKPYTPTAKDSTDYRAGFEDAVSGKKKLFPSKSRVAGYNEAKDRGMTPKRR